jgi:plastocyanin
MRYEMKNPAGLDEGLKLKSGQGVKPAETGVIYDDCTMGMACITLHGSSAMKHLFHTISFSTLRRLLLTVGFGVVTVAATAQTASIEGTVVLPKAKTTAPSGDRYGLKAGQIAPPPAPVAVVYLEGQFNNVTNAATTNRWQMPQQGFQFAQSVLPVQKGSYVEFPNMDVDYHNVFSYSKTKRFDLGRYRKDEKPAAVQFDTPGLVKLYCEIHEHMRANILVLDTPYFVTTTPEGTFKLENLPAGSYVLKAWVDDKDIRSQPVELKAGETLKVEFKGK